MGEGSPTDKERIQGKRRSKGGGATERSMKDSLTLWRGRAEVKKQKMLRKERTPTERMVKAS